MGEPSLRYTKVSLFCGIPGIHFEYISGRNQRHEYRNSQGDRYGPLRALILNLDLHYGFDLDLEARIYSEKRITDSGFLLDPGPRQIERKPSGRTRHYHIETVDTGKRRQMFGHTARRVKMRTTEKVEPQGDSPKTETDGWYIDPPAAWLRLYPQRAGFGYTCAVIGNLGERDEVRFTRSGAHETGFPLILERRRDGRLEHRDKVIELSEDTLDPGLFLPPEDFKPVPQLPSGPCVHRYSLGTRMRLRCLMLMDRPGRVGKKLGILGCS
jgi:hypothetical protein